MHTGGLPGYVSRVVMIPDLNVGVAVLTNQESGEAFDSIAFHVLDHYLGAPPFDWIDGYREGPRARGGRRRGRPRARGAASRDAASKPSLPLAEVRRHLPRRLVRRHHDCRGRRASW